MIEKVALIFWWMALTPQPNVGMSVGVTSGGQGEVINQGIHQMKPMLFDDAETCRTEQKRLETAHKDDLIIMSICGGAGMTGLRGVTVPPLQKFNLNLMKIGPTPIGKGVLIGNLAQVIQDPPRSSFAPPTTDKDGNPIPIIAPPVPPDHAAAARESSERSRRRLQDIQQGR